MELSEKAFSCDQCEKRYGKKHHLTRHKASKHSTEAASFTPSCPEGSPVEYKDADTTKDTGKFPCLVATELIFGLSDRVRLRKNDHIDFYLLEKGTIRLTIAEKELKELMKHEAEINTCILELQYKKELRYLQHLGENIHVSIQNPYNCVDIRQFWTIPHTEQIHPTKIGIALKVSEFWCLMKLLKQLFV